MGFANKQSDRRGGMVNFSKVWLLRLLKANGDQNTTHTQTKYNTDCVITVYTVGNLHHTIKIAWTELK